MAKRTPPSLLALGGKELPPRIEVGGRHYEHRQTFKNDFFAITAEYSGEGGNVLLKVNRQARFLLMPMRWVGRILANRECAALRRLEGLEGVPRLLARWGATGFVRQFVEGHPLAKGEAVGDEFHGRLRGIVEEIHRRGMAYVDLEKCENVLVGEDGRPWLFDFQIAWYLAPRWGGALWPARVVRRWFQKGDLYHLTKLQRRTRPDQLSEAALRASYRRPWYVRWHRRVTWPFTWCRRKVLGRIDPRRKVGERGRVEPEEFMGVL